VKGSGFAYLLLIIQARVSDPETGNGQLAADAATG